MVVTATGYNAVMRGVLDDLACRVLADFGLSPPIDPRVLAVRLGLTLHPEQVDTACLVGRRIIFDEGAIPQRQAGLVSHEIGHHLLRTEALPDTEPHASYLGAALQLPAPAIARDIAECGVDLEELRRRHPHASATLIALRIGELRHGRVSVWERDEYRWSRGYGPRGPAAQVRGVARSAWRTRAVSGLGDTAGTHTWAWPLGDGWVVVIESRQ